MADWDSTPEPLQAGIRETLRAMDDVSWATLVAQVRPPELYDQNEARRRAI